MLRSEQRTTRRLAATLWVVLISASLPACPERGAKPCAKEGATKSAGTDKAAGSGEATRSETPEPKEPVNQPAKPITDLAAPAPLADEPPAKVLEKLLRAHYDPMRLGMTRLRFTAKVRMKNKKGLTELGVRGSWRPGKAPEVKIERVLRDGKEVKQQGGELSKTLFTSLRYRTRHLLDGLGHGFMRKRLDGYKALLEGDRPDTKKLDASTKLAGEQLELTFVDAKTGKMTFVIDRAYRIVKAINVLPGITREMRYEHAMRGGRNLVKRATMSVKIDKDEAKLPDKGKVVMAAADGMTFSFRFVKVGSFFLPAHLERQMPATEDRITIDLEYK